MKNDNLKRVMKHVFVCLFYSIMLGLMLPTWFLSMWISNTATASMMIPIANAVLGQIEEVSPNTSTSFPLHSHFFSPLLCLPVPSFCSPLLFVGVFLFCGMRGVCQLMCPRYRYQLVCMKTPILTFTTRCGFLMV